MAEELADVAIYCMHMADALDLDLLQAISDKLDANIEKYPVEKAKGSSKKYTELDA
jgi:NTP pyrophosphatase (non-canonical NTP hydrolase)